MRSSGLVLSLFSLVLVWGAPDPTKVCLPDFVQFFQYSIETDETSQIAIDFKQNLLTSVSTNSTVIDDYNKLKSYSVDTSGNCQYVILSVEEIFPQCLPVTSTYIGELFIGFGPNRVPAEVWDTPFKGVTFRVAYSKQSGNPSYPILTKLMNAPAGVQSTFYFNPSLNITLPNAFKIPEPCPPATVG